MRQLNAMFEISRKQRKSGWTLFLLAAVALFESGCSGPPLKPWHTERLTEEFRAKDADEIRTFDAYRQLEERLFAQLDEKVYANTETGTQHALERYSTGSAADFRERKPDWNRSFELPAKSPAGGVLLLHGMSDSPYSLRALGEELNRRNYWVLGPRLPGHGTAPSGLRRIKWEDMAAVVRLGVAHLASKVGSKPIHIVGYSNGAPLALNFTLDALEGSASPIPTSLVLISPAIGIHPAAALAGFKNGLSAIPGLGRLAWVSIQPEFDPYKYNSFATNAGTQVHRVTRAVSRRLSSWIRSGDLKKFPPTLVLKSTVDATVSTTAVENRLLRPLGPHSHELVLFDINRLTVGAAILITDPGPLTNRLMADKTLPFTITLVTNKNPESRQVVIRQKPPFTTDIANTAELNVTWPSGVISLSHVALPFPPDDPLYGRIPPDDANKLFLGQIPLQGERGLLKISTDWLFRLRHNPFYDYLQNRSLAWMDEAGSR